MAGRDHAGSGDAIAPGSQPAGDDPVERLTAERLTAERDDLLSLLDRARADRASGELDEVDADALIDDYTARIAGLTRAIDGDEASGAGKQGDTPADAAAGQPGAAPSALNRRTLVWVAVVVAFALLAGILVVQSAGRRGAGETFTGDIRQTTRDLLLGARDQIAVGEFDEALATYDEVLAIAPANVEALTYSAWVGRTMARSIDDDTALALLDDAVAIDPQYPDARVFQAIILRDLGRFSEAQVALDGLGDDDIPDFLVMQVEALRLEVSGADPDRIDIVRAEAAARTGDFAQALRLLDAVIERSPDNVEAIIAKVDVLLVVSSAASGDDRVLLLTNAGQLVDRAQAIDPDDPAPVLYEALVLELQGQTAEALAVLDSLEARDGLDPAVVAEIGALRSRLGG